jgi:hypothetical protein
MGKREKRAGSSRAPRQRKKPSLQQQQQQSRQPPATAALDDIEEQLRRQRAKQQIKKEADGPSTNDDDRVTVRPPPEKQLGDYVYDEERKTYFPKNTLIPSCNINPVDESHNEPCMPRKNRRCDILEQWAFNLTRSSRHRARAVSRWTGHSIFNSYERTFDILSERFSSYSTTHHGWLVMTIEESNVYEPDPYMLYTINGMFEIAPWNRNFDVLPLNGSHLPQLVHSTGSGTEFCVCMSDPNNKSSPLWSMELEYTIVRHAIVRGMRFCGADLGVLSYDPFLDTSTIRVVPTANLESINSTATREVGHRGRASIENNQVRCQANDFCATSPDTIVMACNQTRDERWYEWTNEPMVVHLGRGQTIPAHVTGFGTADALCIEPDGDTADGALFGHRDGSLTLWDPRSPYACVNTGLDVELNNVVALHSLSPLSPHQWLVRGSRGVCRLYDIRRAGSNCGGKRSRQIVHEFSIPNGSNLNAWKCSGIATDPTHAVVITPFNRSNDTLLSVWSLYSGDFIGSRSVLAGTIHSPPYHVKLCSTRTSAWKWCSVKEDAICRRENAFGLWIAITSIQEEGTDLQVQHVCFDGRYE